MRTPALLAAATLAAAVLTACSSGEGEHGEESAKGDGGAQDAAVEDRSADIPDTPAGDQARWIIDLLAEDADDPTAAEVAVQISPDADPSFTPELFLEGLPQIRAVGPFTVTAVSESDAATVVVRLEGQEPFDLTIGVDADGLLLAAAFAPALPVPEADSYDALLDEVGSEVENAQIYVADIADGACTTSSDSPDSSGGDLVAAPSGSVFKTIVLAAVAAQVESGQVGWDDTLTITADVKSLPSGELQDRPDGSTVTVQEAAELMISISDNTATDLLMSTVGDDAIDAVMQANGLGDAIPLMTTRQFFQLGWGASSETDREAWADASATQRQEILAGLPFDVPATSVVEPAWPAGVEWFLTPEQICGVYASLDAAADTASGAPVRDILALSPGVQQVPEGIDYLGFKGGNSPGVVATSFIAEVGGETRFFSLQTWDSERLDTVTLVLGAAQAGVDLLVE